VKDAAKHPLVAAAEGQIEALFGCPALRGPHKPLAKIEALQGESRGCWLCAVTAASITCMLLPCMTDIEVFSASQDCLWACCYGCCCCCCYACPATLCAYSAVIKYHKGEFYHEHYDNRADSPLTRAATIIVYLCDTDAGGATSFPRAVLAGQAPGSYAAAPAGTAAALPGLSSSSSSAGFGVQGGGSGKSLGGGGWRLSPKVSVGVRGVGIKVFPVRGRAVVFW
jgi:hypothetical protein